MSQYDKTVIDTFLKNQLQLFPERVAESAEEAAESLDICGAAVCKNLKEVRQYFDECGADISGMSNQDLAEAQEVFALPDGRYLVVEG